MAGVSNLNARRWYIAVAAIVMQLVWVRSMPGLFLRAP